MEIQGVRINSVNYHNGDGFYYRKSKIKETVEGRIMYVECVINNCKGRGKINLDLNPADWVVTATFAHILHGLLHEPDFSRVSRQELLTELKRIAPLEPDTHLRELFDRECER